MGFGEYRRMLANGMDLADVLDMHARTLAGSLRYRAGGFVDSPNANHVASGVRLAADAIDPDVAD